MWMTWNDLDRHFAALDLLRREVERNLTGSGPEARQALGRWPEATLADAGDRFVFTVDVPGLRDDELSIDVHQSALTVAAHRAVPAPEGYATHRSERTSFDWKRTITLPAKVDAERTGARLRDGVLVVELAKVPESQPRRITIA